MTQFIKTSIILIASLMANNKVFATDQDGKTTYEQACSVCHTNGIAGAPKLGDVEIWIDRLDSGKDPLYISAINGKGAMPPKGGQAAISDAAVKAAVDYMISKSQ